MYLDAVKTVRILMNMDFVDEGRVAATGKSQGGALALAAATLEPPGKAVRADVPFSVRF